MSEPECPQKAPYAADVEKGKKYAWCSCGRSTNQPFCDGSHKGSDFSPVVWDAAESGKVYFCGCKKTLKTPMCDGTHKSI
jgi:CDGSH-type Zn-finger protein